MFSKLLIALMGTIFAFFDADEIREDIDDFIDKIEAKVEARPDSVKKSAVLSALNLGRSVVGIPDDIGGDED